MENSFCDNVDCSIPINVKQTLYLTVLHKDFDYDICFWCADCIKKEQEIIFLSELDFIELYEQNQRLRNELRNL